MTHTHPTHDQLSDFGLGRMHDADAAAIESHLTECEPCRKVVEELPSDSLVSLLQDTHSGLEAGQPGDTPTMPPLPSVANARTGTPADDSNESLPNELANHPRYRVVGRLGAGGMGTVFKARHNMMEREVALKIMNPELLDRPKAVEQFRQEVKAAAQLSHANIVTAHDAETVGSLHFLVMEFVEGRTLARLVEERRFLQVREACRYVRQAALGLQHAHERGMVHRDIKPQNLIRAANGSVKILDFGLARFRSESQPANGGSEHAVLMGSPDYMAPEQARSARTADIRADIYGLGCTLYQLLTGQVPFPGGSSMDKIAAHLQKTPTPLRVARPDVPEALSQIVDKMMAKDPAARFQTPAEVASALEPFADVAVAAKPQAARRLPWIIAACGIAIVASIVLFFGPTILRYTTNQGQVVIETDDKDVEIVVKKGGEQVRIIDTKTQKEIVLQAGRYELELSGSDGWKLVTRDFTLERGGKTIIRVRLEPIPKPVVAVDPKKEEPKKDLPAGSMPDFSFKVGDRRFLNPMAFLSETAIQAELKMTEAQKEIIRNMPPLSRDQRSFNLDEAQFRKLLTPEQVNRFRQIQLQRLLATPNNGPVYIFRYQEVVEALKLTEMQARRIHELGEERRIEYGERAFGQPAPAGWRERVDELDAKIEAEMEKLLTAPQHAVMKELIGPLFVDRRTGDRPTRGMTIGGTEFRFTKFVMNNYGVQQELKLSDDQKQKIAALPESTIDESALRGILSPEQYTRAREVMRYGSTLQTTQYGKLHVLRYSDVVESLRLTPQQTQKLQKRIDDRGVPRGPGSTRTRWPDSQVQALLDEVLTAEQREKFKDIVGAPFTYNPLARAPAAPNAAEAFAGRKLFDEAKYAEAIIACNETIQLDPNFADAYQVRGQCYARTSEHVKAIADFGAALRLKHPSPTEVYFWRAYSNLNLRAFEACLADSDEFFKRNPIPGYRGTGLSNRAWAYASLGEYDKALNDYAEILKINPNVAQPYYSRSLVYSKLGETEKAAADMAKALQLDPEANKKWGHFTDHISAPAPLRYWLRGRTILRVAQDGSQPFRTIQQALDAVKPGEVIQIMDRGPYRETPRMPRPVENVGLISEAGTRIEITAWQRFAGADAKDIRYFAMNLLCPNGLRLAGLDIVYPQIPADASWTYAVDAAAAGEVVVENCRILRSGGGLAERCSALFLGWQGEGSIGRGRFVIQECVVEGELFFKNTFPAKLQVHRNLIRTGQWNAICVPTKSRETIIRHNVIQSFNGILVYTRDEENSTASLLIANNVIDVANAVIWHPVPAPDITALPLKQVRIQNNILRSQAGSGIEIHAKELDIISKLWTVGNNCYSTTPKSLPTNFPALPQSSSDFVTAAQFLSADLNNPHYLRIAPESPLATSGAGGELPRYVGAFPPGPPPQVGDWFTRLNVATAVAPTASGKLEEGKQRQRENKHAEAIAALNESLALDPNLTEAYQCRGVSHWHVREFAKSAMDFTQAIQRNPPYLANSLSWRAGAFLALKAYEACVIDVDECLRQNPSQQDRASALGARAWAWAVLGNYEQAARDYEDAEKLQQRDGAFYFYRSKVYNRLRDFDKARADHAKAIALDVNVEKNLAHIVDEIAIPPSIDAWRRGRNVLKVSQDGKNAFTRISDALNAAKHGDVIEVLDKGPYREAPRMTKPIDDLSLISTVGTRIEIPEWHFWGKTADKRMVYQGCIFSSTNGLRLYGFEIVVPASPVANADAIAVDLQVAGDVVIEKCRIIQTLPSGTNIALLAGWHGAGSIGRGRYVVQDCAIEGAVMFKQDFHSQVLVQRNWLKSPGNALQLPLAEGKVTVRHNIIQGGNGIVFRERAGGKNLPAHVHRYDICNNTIDAANCPIWHFADANDKTGTDVCKSVRIENNILRSGSGTGIELFATDHPAVNAQWRLGHNAYSAEPKLPGPQNLPTVGHVPTDRIGPIMFLSMDDKNSNFLRLATDGPLATAGRGFDLPRHIGALPPGPPPKDGDWFMRLR
jgi:serine/threonine protein kinase/tetratricopeptide (TPR) repeat protein